MPAGAAPATGATPTTGRTRDITCFRCSGHGHVSQVYRLVIQKNLNILCLPLTIQLRRTYMSIRGTPIGMKVLLSNVFLVHRSPQLRRISNRLCSIRRVLCRSGRFASSSTAVAATI
jgi:hypothetical protein